MLELGMGNKLMDHVSSPQFNESPLKSKQNLAFLIRNVVHYSSLKKLAISADDLTVFKRIVLELFGMNDNNVLMDSVIALTMLGVYCDRSGSSFELEDKVLLRLVSLMGTATGKNVLPLICCLSQILAQTHWRPSILLELGIANKLLPFLDRDDLIDVSFFG
jgi:hypothetical protein